MKMVTLTQINRISITRNLIFDYNIMNLLSHVKRVFDSEVAHSGGRKALNQSGLFNFGGILV